jgi:hypothetical protein
MSMKQNAAVGPYGTLGYPIEISRKGEYFAQLCGRHQCALQPHLCCVISGLSLIWK